VISGETQWVSASETLVGGRVAEEAGSGEEEKNSARFTIASVLKRDARKCARKGQSGRPQNVHAERNLRLTKKDITDTISSDSRSLSSRE